MGGRKQPELQGRFLCCLSADLIRVFVGDEEEIQFGRFDKSKLSNCAIW